MSLIKHIPNGITSLNLLSGVLGIIAVMGGRVDLAFPLMLLASLFDFCDGLTARALGAYSERGKELDSLSDLVSFGVLPALMLFHRMDCAGHAFSGWLYASKPFLESLPCVLTLLLAVFSGLRLAKFNTDERQHASFLGLPTPACAILCGSLVYFECMDNDSMLGALCDSLWFLPLLALTLSTLLVSEIPMFSFKHVKGEKTAPGIAYLHAAFLGIAAAALLIVLLWGYNWSLGVLLTILGYILLNCTLAVLSPKKAA